MALRRGRFHEQAVTIQCVHLLFFVRRARQLWEILKRNRSGTFDLMHCTNEWRNCKMMAEEFGFGKMLEISSSPHHQIISVRVSSRRLASWPYTYICGWLASAARRLASKWTYGQTKDWGAACHLIFANDCVDASKPTHRIFGVSRSWSWMWSCTHGTTKTPVQKSMCWLFSVAYRLLAPQTGNIYICCNVPLRGICLHTRIWIVILIWLNIQVWLHAWWPREPTRDKWLF